MSIFAPALNILSRQTTGLYSPTSFQKYLTQHGLKQVDTARYISIDTYERLDSALKAADAMVFRLGTSADGKSTQFALAKVSDALPDFFIYDDQTHTNSPATFLPTASFRQLYPYQLLSLQSEAALVNLGVVSGLIGRALNLDENDQPIVPATGQSVFSFDFKAHQSLDIQLTHNRGQVQTDVLFVGRRAEKEILFVVEAKCNPNAKSLAKHKLVYPILALAQKVPNDIEIVPVYLKINKTSTGIIYHVAECMFPDPRGQVRAVDELSVARCKSLFLPLSIIS